MIKSFLAIILNLFKSRTQLQLENLFLRKQLEIFSRSNKRVSIKRRDRVFFCITKGLLNNWRSNLVIVKPETVIGKNTITSMQAGIIYGYVGLIDGIVNRMRKEMGADPLVIATGGLAPLIAPESETIEEVDAYLTLKGLHIIYVKNK